MKKIILAFSMVFVVGLLGISAFADGQNQNYRNFFGSYQMNNQYYGQMYNAHGFSDYNDMQNYMSSYGYGNMEQMYNGMMNGYNGNYGYGRNNEMSTYGYGMMNY